MLTAITMALTALLDVFLNVSAREDMLDENENIDADKFETITYDPTQIAYRKMGGFAEYATQVCDIHK